MSNTAHRRPHRKVKAPHRNLAEAAFHLRHAIYAWERLDAQHEQLSPPQQFAVRGVGTALRACLTIVTAAQDGWR